MPLSNEDMDVRNLLHRPMIVLEMAMQSMHRRQVELQSVHDKQERIFQENMTFAKRFTEEIEKMRTSLAATKSAQVNGTRDYRNSASSSEKSREELQMEIESVKAERDTALEVLDGMRNTLRMDVR